ncbi:MAG: HAD family hydrolase [Candidatus Bathyarchaeota archaeon]|nr:HAD family hydrolase [Candidatus Bathyarchaeota archaeon]
MITKAVLFDMGNTLIKFDVGSPEEVFHKVLASMGIIRSVDEIKRAFWNAEEEAKNLNLLSLFGKIQREEYWHKWDSLVLKHLCIEEGKELAKVVQSKWFDHVDCTPYPEVKMVLSKLKQKELALGLISNAYEEEINRTLRKASLEKEIFDIIVGVDTIKSVKPNPDIFRHAISKLNARPEETIFVGDNAEADYKGAENAGLHALLIDRTENMQRNLRTIRNLKEIFSQIDSDFCHRS